MTTRKVYEIVIRIFGLVMVVGAVTYGLYSTAGRLTAPMLQSGGYPVYSTAIATTLIGLALGLALILIAPSIAKRLEPSEVGLALSTAISSGVILRMAIQIVGSVFVARGLADLIGDLVMVAVYYEGYGLSQEAIRLVYPGAQIIVGGILLFGARQKPQEEPEKATE